MISLSMEEWLLIGRAVLLVFFFVLSATTFAAWRRAAIRQSELAQTHDAEILKRLEALDTGLLAARNALAGIAEAMDRSLRSDATGSRASGGYPIAIRMARSGAGAQEVMEACGLSASEAELVCRLHGSSARAATA